MKMASQVNSDIQLFYNFGIVERLISPLLTLAVAVPCTMRYLCGFGWKFYIISTVISLVLVPEQCSLRKNRKDCRIAASYIVSINTQNEEFMIGVTCEEHKQEIESRLQVLQRQRALPDGFIRFQPLKILVTECIKSDHETAEQTP
jgi:hypothetical protein